MRAASGGVTSSIANNSPHELIGAVDLADAIEAVDGEVAAKLIRWRFA